MDGPLGRDFDFCLESISCVGTKGYCYIILPISGTLQDTGASQADHWKNLTE